MGTEIEVPITMHIETQPEDKKDKEVEIPAAAEELPDPRKDVMADIYANRNKQIEKELELHKEMSRAHGDEPAEIQEEVAPPSEPAPEPAPAAAPVTEPAPEPEPEVGKEYNLAVNGRTVKMNEQEVIAAAQKVLSANELFQQASRLRNETEAMRAQPQQTAQPTQPQLNDPMSLVDDNTADSIIKKINFGSELEQRTAIRELSAAIQVGLGRVNNGPTPDQIVEVATQRALAHITFQNNLATIGNEFKDIFLPENRPLAIAAADQVGQLRLEYAAKGVMKNDLELYREACTTISKYLPKKEVVQENAAPVAPSTPIQAATSTEKLERKRVAPQPPAAASKIATEQPKQKGYDPSAIVQQMRKSRGQSAYN